MALGILTITQILQQGCQLGGNPSLANTPAGYTEPLAQTFLKLWLHHVFMTRDLGFLLKEASITTSANTPSDPTLPSYAIDLTGLARYRGIKAIKLDTVQNQLEQEQQYYILWARLKADLDVSSTTPPTGAPVKFAIKPDKSQAYVHPIPDKVYTGKVLYYSLPDVASYTGSTIPDYEDSYTMVQAVGYYVRNYDKDTMVEISRQAADRLLGEYRGSQDDAGRNRPLSVKLDPFVVRFQSGD